MTNLLAFMLGISLLGGLTDGAPKKADAVPAEAPKPVEVAVPSEAPKPAEVAKPVAEPKPVAVTKPAETSKPAETKRPVSVTVSRSGKGKVREAEAAKDGKRKSSLFGGKAGKNVQAGPRTVRITSQRTDYDRKAGVIMFDRDVFVNDPEYKMRADQLYVFLDGTNDLRRIVALGNVAITNETRSGSCAKATYTKALSRIVMYGDGTNVVARLKDAGKRKSEVCGRKITFWIDSEQVEVEGSEVLLDAGSVGGKDGAKKFLGK